MNSCLVVGGTGLVGKHLVKELEASGRKITKSSPKQNKVTISFKSKIRKLKKR